MELEAALQQLKMTHMEQNRIAVEAAGSHAITNLQEVQRAKEVKNEKCEEEAQQDGDVTSQGVKDPQTETNSIHNEVMRTRCPSEQPLLILCYLFCSDWVLNQRM